MVLIRYADEKVKKALYKIKKRDPKFHEHVSNALRNIQEDSTCGIKVPQKLIPKEWKKIYGINNLYKYNLPNAWRLLYSLIGGQPEIIAIVLGCFNHKEYERFFNY